MLKYNQHGISHLLLPLAIVIIAAVVGTFMLVSSKADSVPVASAAGSGCPNGYKMVNARPQDFFSKKYRDMAISQKGLLCLKRSGGREIVHERNNNTIIDYFKCTGSRVFAYDINNPQSKDYKLKWKVESFNGAEKEGHTKKNYYCINKKDLYVDRAHNGVDIDNATVYWYTHKDQHLYKFFPAYSQQEPCVGGKLKFTGCRQNYFFSYYGGKDIRNR